MQLLGHLPAPLRFQEVRATEEQLHHVEPGTLINIRTNKDKQSADLKNKPAYTASGLNALVQLLQDIPWGTSESASS